jgi:transketolase
MLDLRLEPQSPLYVQRESARSLAEEAALLRREIVMALHHSGGGHYGGALSVLDLLLTLYRRELRVCPPAGNHPDRDRLILSKGHAAIALYAVLRRLGYFEHALDQYASLGSPLEGHPDGTSLTAVDFSSGSLGQGLSVGLGMALALRPRRRHVWVILGDGECQEGQVWEAAMLAARCGLDNLHAVIDHNRQQEWGFRRAAHERALAPVDRLEEKWSAFGWQVQTTDGHDFAALEATFAAARRVAGAPSLVIANTVKGKGFPLIEHDPARFHCGALSDAEYASVLEAAPC